MRDGSRRPDSAPAGPFPQRRQHGRAQRHGGRRQTAGQRPGPRATSRSTRTACSSRCSSSSHRSVPLDVILLLDTSSSMSDKMEVVHEAAKGFMKMLRPGDRGAVVAFADNGERRPGPDHRCGRDRSRPSIRSSAKGSTSLWTTPIYIALKQFGRARAGHRRGAAPGDRRAVGRRRHRQSWSASKT